MLSRFPLFGDVFSESPPRGSCAQQVAPTRRIPIHWVSRLWLSVGILAVSFGAFHTPVAAQFQFRRGDANLDAAINVADPVLILSALFSGGALPCDSAADVNDDEAIDIADPVGLLGFLFSGGIAPLPPFPDCGGDPTAGTLACGIGGPCPLDLPPDQPLLVSSTPAEGRPGTVLVLAGRNFSQTLTENRVDFVDGSGEIRIPGALVEVTVDPFVPGLGAPSTLTVVVPSEVRSGAIELFVETGAGTQFAGSLAFTAAPVITSIAIGTDGTAIAILRDASLTIFPDEVVILGRNLATATSVRIFDGLQVTFAPSITLGLPPTVSYLLPPGLEALTVELPPGLLPNFCTTALLQFLLAGTTPSGAILESPPFEVPYAFINVGSANISDIGFHVSAARLPIGVRGGDVEVLYTAVSEPVTARWILAAEYRDPNDPTGQTWLPATPVLDGESEFAVLPGSALDFAPGFIVPGSLRRFAWDSLTDIPAADGRVVTALRFRGTDPFPTLGTPSNCLTQYQTEQIVIDNSASALDPLLSIVVEFDDAAEADPETTALWDAGGAGFLTSPLGAGPVTSFGSGTVDLALVGGGSYLFDTDASTVFDVGGGVPVDLLPGQPGAASGEIHLRSLFVESAATIEIVGSNPLVIRCQGDGTDTFIAADLSGVFDLSGEDGTEGTTSPPAPGLGGAAGPGGGAGGQGGEVTVDFSFQTVVGVQPAIDGALGGGEGGRNTTLILAGTTVSVPRAGQGGGGGHSVPGEDGVNDFFGSLTSFNNPTGRGGPAYGDAKISILRGGSGGGGGGATPVRLSATNFQTRNGGGGGGGGGAFELVAQGAVRVAASIVCDGGNGARGAPGNQAGAGGGGAGGAIAIRATGDLALVSSSGGMLSARGGFGGLQSPSIVNELRGGHGATGRVRLESNVTLLVPGAADLSSSLPEPGALGHSSGTALGPIDVGTGVDGPLGPSQLGGAGDYTIDTSNGTIRNSAGAVVFTNMSGGGLFELSSLDFPVGYALFGEGTEPLVLLSTGTVEIAGSIDVSGQDGGLPDLALLIPGVGGAGGPGGGSGGGGGIASLTSAGDGAPGGYPPTLPLLLINPPGGGPGSPIPTSPITVATGGSAGTGACIGGSAGGAGFTVAGFSANTPGGCPAGTMAGGSAFGSDLFFVPDPVVLGGTLELKTGGTGGAGGGGGTNLSSIFSPGSGGGGAGGYLEIAAGSDFHIRGTAEISARGGGAFQSATGGGNGSSGAGGAIRLRGRANFAIESGAFFDARAGQRNLNPPPILISGYFGNGSIAAAASSVGRIRVESAIGFLANNPTSGFPDPSAGLFETAGLTPFVALTRPSAVTVDGVVRPRPISFDPAVVTPVGALAPGTLVRVLYEGAERDPVSPERPGVFTGTTDDPSILAPFEFIRARILLYASPTAAPEVQSVELPYTVF